MGGGFHLSLFYDLEDRSPLNIAYATCFLPEELTLREAHTARNRIKILARLHQHRARNFTRLDGKLPYVTKGL